MKQISVGTVAPKRARIELPYLDGMRGLAALYVALYHAYLFTGDKGDHHSLPVVGYLVGYGYLGVPVFIVLSGYVLMLPVTQNGLSFPRGVKKFIRNRARRILPPYYAALAASLLLVALVPVMQAPSGTQWDSKVPVTVPDVMSHALLLHDFSDAWIGKINGPLWSVAVEWHIYFLMPFVLIPLWRKIGGFATTALALAASFAMAWAEIGSFAHPWFIALFAAGMLAAEVSIEGRVAVKPLVVSLAVIAGAAVAAKEAFDGDTLNSFTVEVAAGLALAVVLAYLGGRSIHGGAPRWVRPLGSRPAKMVGLFSYSVYLLHSPLLALGNLLLRPLDLPTMTQYLLMTFVVLPCALALCWVFYLLVERHFLNTRQKHITRG